MVTWRIETAWLCNKAFAIHQAIVPTWPGRNVGLKWPSSICVPFPSCVGLWVPTVPNNTSGICARLVAMRTTSWQRRTTTVFEACGHYTCHQTLVPQNEVTDVATAAVQLAILAS